MYKLITKKHLSSKKFNYDIKYLGKYKWDKNKIMKYHTVSNPYCSQRKNKIKLLYKRKIEIQSRIKIIINIFDKVNYYYFISRQSINLKNNYKLINIFINISRQSINLKNK